MILKRRLKGISIVEAMVAATVVSIAVLGGITYRYYATLDGKRAKLQSTAARAALLLCESWRGEGGDENFDPIILASEDFIIDTGNGPDEPAGFTLLGKYQIEYNEIKCYATLSFKDVRTTLRALDILVAWQSRDEGEDELDDMDKLFELTTYITY